MKKLFFLLLLTNVLVYAQSSKYILTTGTNGYVTVYQRGNPPMDYTRGNVVASFYISPKGDTQMKLSTTNGVSILPITSNYLVDTNYQNGDASYGNFPNADSLYRWTRRHLQKYVGN